jgi:hypothetical protein
MNQPELEAYLDEALPAEEMARIEDRLRREPELLAELAAINSRRDAGVHSLGEIWRRHRLSCPPREQLGGLLLGTLSRPQAQYLRFHIDIVGCRLCQASLADLENQQAEAAEAVQTRRRRYFQSSAGYLNR